MWSFEGHVINLSAFSRSYVESIVKRQINKFSDPVVCFIELSSARDPIFDLVDLPETEFGTTQAATQGWDEAVYDLINTSNAVFFLEIHL
ncbi:hypothetical protein KOW79_001637 [Hemibagrus wyckioides]|uniref:Uncharacterized protein n=1 Tax=Hemibagrus wyckioides TaxID=337641 RepID=A0A9D3P6P9_9TELE|nr:hypothetical protein KOW79_001637 [Hemibagrus wyckioides]